MKKEKGYIKLFRKLGDNPISSNLELIGLLSSFLLKANREGKTFFLGTYKVRVEAGEFAASSIKLSQEYGISRGKFNRLVSELQNEGIIDIKGYNKYTIYKILNRSLYQEDKQQEVQGKDNTGYTDKNIYINKVYILYKDIDNNIDIYIKEEKVFLKICDFVEQRKNLKKQMTDKAIGLFIKKVIKLKNKYEDDVIIEIIDEAIERNRLTIFDTNFKGREKKQDSSKRGDFNFFGGKGTSL